MGHKGITSSTADASSIKINQREKKWKSSSFYCVFHTILRKPTHLCSGVCQLCHRLCLSPWSGCWYHVHVYVWVRAFPSGLWRGTAHWFSQWRLSPTLGRCHRRPCSCCMCASEPSALLFVWTSCENNLLVACIKSWLSTLHGFLSLQSISFPFSRSVRMHMSEQAHSLVCVCLCVLTCACMCSCCPCRIYCCSPSAAQSKWMTYQSCFLSFYCLRIIWKCFRLLNAPQCGMLWIIQRLSLRPPATVTIFPLFICFLCVYPHCLVGGEKGKSREAAHSFCANGFDKYEEPSLCPSTSRRGVVYQPWKFDLSELRSLPLEFSVHYQKWCWLSLDIPLAFVVAASFFFFFCNSQRTLSFRTVLVQCLAWAGEKHIHLVWIINSCSFRN